jgi:hypothetical protein
MSSGVQLEQPSPVFVLAGLSFEVLLAVHPVVEYTDHEDS